MNDLIFTAVSIAGICGVFMNGQLYQENHSKVHFVLALGCACPAIANLFI